MVRSLADGIEGKLHVITGGYSDIAIAAAELIGTLGGRVVLLGRDVARGEEVAGGLTARTGAAIAFRQLDVTDPEATAAIAEQIQSDLGPVSSLLVNAMAVVPGKAFDLPADAWRKTMSVTLDGAFFSAQAFARGMRGTGGSIVLVSSAAATKVTWPPAVVSYSAAKAAVSHLGALLGVEWASENIRVNVIAPGHIDTSATRGAAARRPEMMAQWVSGVPIGRLIGCEELANQIVFLLSDLSLPMTASVLTADGGYTRR